MASSIQERASKFQCVAQTVKIGQMFWPHFGAQISAVRFIGADEGIKHIESYSFSARKARPNNFTISSCGLEWPATTLATAVTIGMSMFWARDNSAATPAV